MVVFHWEQGRVFDLAVELLHLFKYHYTINNKLLSAFMGVQRVH